MKHRLSSRLFKTLPPTTPDYLPHHTEEFVSCFTKVYTNTRLSGFRSAQANMAESGKPPLLKTAVADAEAM
jgi:hypothetical protein